MPLSFGEAMQPRDASPTMIACLSPGQGGMELDSLKLAELLSPHMELVLLCQKGAFIEREAVKRSIDVAPVHFRSRTFSLALIKATRHTIKTRKVRNVIFFGSSELKSLFFAFRGQNLNIIVRHGTTKSTPKLDWIHRKVYSCVRHHVVISQHLKRNVEKIFPTSPPQIQLIYPSLQQK